MNELAVESIDGLSLPFGLFKAGFRVYGLSAVLHVVSV